MSTELQVVSHQGREVVAEDFLPLLSVEQAIERKKQINKYVQGVMTEGEDYGKIPGGQQKPVLLKPGAEKLSSIFGLAPRYVVESEVEDWMGANHGGEPFFSYRYRCQLYRADRFMGEAIGSCNSWETKYRWRNATRKCPECGVEAIIAGKAEYGGGWLCFKKKNGCGAKFAFNDERIQGQEVGKVPNPDVADQVNTFQKMAQKRALVAAVLVVTNCSDAFTQDLLEEDDPIDTGGHPVGTQAAADHVAQEKIKKSKKTEPEPRTPDADVPEALKPIFAKLSESGRTMEAMKLLRGQLIEQYSETGEVTWGRITKAHGFERGKDLPPLINTERVLLEAFELIKQSLEMKESLAKTAAAAKVMAPDLFGQPYYLHATRRNGARKEFIMALNTTLLIEKLLS